jgi:DNA modification methylase
MKPYYSEKGIEIYCGDCREVLRQLDQVDLVLTDPPYGIRKAEWDEVFVMPWELFGHLTQVLTNL